jgi:hypothetical protein
MIKEAPDLALLFWVPAERKSTPTARNYAADGGLLAGPAAQRPAQQICGAYLPGLPASGFLLGYSVIE